MSAVGANETKLATRIVNGFKNASTTIGGRSVTQNAWVAGVYTGFGVQTIQTGKSFSSELRTLKQLYADLTGVSVNQISTMKALFGAAPPFVKEARHSIAKHILPEALVNVLSFVINLKLTRNNMSGKKQIALIAMQMGGGSVVSWLVGTENFLPMYAALYDMQAKGQAVPPEAYAEFLGTASKDARNDGGAGNTLVQAVAIRYAERQASPAQIVKDIESGVFNQIALEEKAKLNALPAEQTAKDGGHEARSISAQDLAAMQPVKATLPATQDAISPKTAMGPHSAKVLNGASSQVEPAALGPKTAQLAARQAEGKSPGLSA